MSTQKLDLRSFLFLESIFDPQEYHPLLFSVGCLDAALLHCRTRLLLFARVLPAMRKHLPVKVKCIRAAVALVLCPVVAAVSAAGGSAHLSLP